MSKIRFQVRRNRERLEDQTEVIQAILEVLCGLAASGNVRGCGWNATGAHFDTVLPDGSRAVVTIEEAVEAGDEAA